MFARLWNALRREPLAHFMALAALLFVAYRLLTPADRDAIVIDRASIEKLVREQEELLARPLTQDERGAVLESAIDDEVLLREAYRRGLERDAVVRHHLVQKMRFILGEAQSEPTKAALEAYLAANRERYRTPPTVTLDHVFYADPAAVPDGLVARLENGAKVDGLGDSLYMLGNTLPRYSLRDLIGLMGRTWRGACSSCLPANGRVPCRPSAACISYGSPSIIRRPCRASLSWRATCARIGCWTSNAARSPTSSRSCAGTTGSWSSRRPDVRPMPT